MNEKTSLPPRAPVPGWLWLLCTAGPVAAGAPLGSVGVFLGFIGAGLLTGGLALASLFLEGTLARVFGALVFACLIVTGFLAIVYASCKNVGSI